MGKTYVMDKTYQISDEIRMILFRFLKNKNMSAEERRRQVKIWEEESRREKEKIIERKILRSI